MILVIYAHPYPQHSRAGKALLAAVRDLPGLSVRSLYDLYPDFDIDVAAEQQALTEAEMVVWLHPIYWYSVPAVLKHWFDVVLLRGWAYGTGGDAITGKACLWVASAGGEQDAYAEDGMHAMAFEHYIPPIQQTARFCGMAWQPPLILHGSHSISDEDIAAAAAQFRARLQEWTAAREKQVETP